MPIVFGCSLGSALLTTLGTQGDASTFSYRDLYAFVGYIICLAMLNAVFAITIGSWLARSPGQRWVYVFGAVVLQSLWWVQLLLGLAPVVLCLRGLVRYPDAGFALYAMPLYQGVVIWFCLHFQGKMIRAYKTHFGPLSRGA